MALLLRRGFGGAVSFGGDQPRQQLAFAACSTSRNSVHRAKTGLSVSCPEHWWQQEPRTSSSCSASSSAAAVTSIEHRQHAQTADIVAVLQICRPAFLCLAGCTIWAYLSAGNLGQAGPFASIAMTAKPGAQGTLMGIAGSPRVRQMVDGWRCYDRLILYPLEVLTFTCTFQGCMLQSRAHGLGLRRGCSIHSVGLTISR